MKIGELMSLLLPLDADKEVTIDLVDGYHERADLKVIGAREDDEQIVLEVR